MGGFRRPHPDTYGRSGRPLGVVLGIVALAVGIGIGVGVVLGRSISPPTQTPPPPTSSPLTAGVMGPGPNGAVHGIPVGYPHTREGAAQAAGNYLATLGAEMDSMKVAAALETVAEPSSRPRLQQALATTRQGEESLWGIQAAAREGRPVIHTQTPIAYKLDTYTPDEATVRVWLVADVGIPNRQRLAAFFGVGSVTLVWLQGDWRLRAIDNGNQAGDVVPACLQTPTPTGGVPAALDGFVPYGR